MELEGSLICSQEPATGPYPELDYAVRITITYFSNSYSNILPLISRSSERSLSFWLSNQNLIWIYLFPDAYYMRVLLDLNILILFVVENKLRNSSFCKVIYKLQNLVSPEKEPEQRSRYNSGL
jgi:hypothetical protein